MIIVDVTEDGDVTPRVGVEFSEGGAAFHKIHRPSLKDVHQWQPRGRAEAGAAVVHNAVGSDVFCSHLVHTAAAQEDPTPPTPLS